MKRVILALAMVLPGSAFATGYDLDPMHSEVGFSVKHMGVTNVHGKFDKFTGTLNFDEKNPNATTATLEAQTDSIDTGVDKRDGHLKSPDFFDAAKNPKVTFKSTSAKLDAQGKGTITGDLTMHGVTKPVTLNLDGISPENKTPFGSIVRATTATTTVSRKDFGLTWNKAIESGGVLVSDEVKIEINAELVKQGSMPAMKK